MLRSILSALSPITRIVSGLHAVQVARLIRERRDAEERARKAERERDGALYRCGILRGARDAAIDERDAARSAHASALADIAEARRLAGAPATSSPQDIVRALLARQN